jgi:hypothetical protein
VSYITRQPANVKPNDIARKTKPGFARRKLYPSHIPKVDIGLEIAVSIFTGAVIEAKADILRLLDEREKASRPPLVQVASPNGENVELYAPDAYVRLSNEAMVSVAGRYAPLGNRPMPESVAAADKIHFAAHHEIIARTNAMLPPNLRRAPPTH